MAVSGVVRALALTALWPIALASAEPAALDFLDARNEPLAATGASLGLSRKVTHDASLPRGHDDVASSDPDNFRLELVDAAQPGSVVYARLESFGADGARHGLLRHVPLVRVANTTRFRSPFVRLVSDTTDLSAPDVGFQLLRARLTDRVVARTSAATPALAERTVGGAGNGSDPRDVLRGQLRIFVLRSARGGRPVLGVKEPEAIALARRQVEIANEIWAQCFIDFGEPADTRVEVVDPPPSALLAVSDLTGLPARGDGSVTFRVAGKRIGPIALSRGALPEQTAQRVMRALRGAGFEALVSVNPRADHAAFPSADVIVREKSGVLAALSADPELPLSSDSQQRVAIGSVDLSDGLTEFDNTISAVGTLEERTLVKLLSDADASTIDVLLVNRFVNRDRQGEAFIEADGSSMANTLIFDRNAVRFERQAWVQAHELGHVLLDEPLHPDNVGPDRPWLLMDADARQGRVLGPKRLTADECAKVRRRSGPGAYPTLLKPLAR